jgi:hypothetical protein
METLKLEPEHILPYVPFGLTGVRRGFDYNTLKDTWTEIVEVKSIAIPSRLDENFRINPTSGSIRIFDFKPLLLPLSELTPNFLVNGYEDVTNYISKNDIIKIVTEKMPVYYIPYGQMQRLFSWHFDVFHLIDKGLAISKV